MSHPTILGYILEYENVLINDEQKKATHHFCEDVIEKSVPQDHRLSSIGKPHDANGNPRDRFFYLTLLIDYSILLQLLCTIIC